MQKLNCAGQELLGTLKFINQII